MKKLKVSLPEFDILETLGTGSFGRVRLAKNKKTGEFVALKMLKKHSIIKQKQVDHIINENTILSDIEHPFLIKMLGFCQDTRYLYFALEFIQGGELFIYLRNQFKLAPEEASFFGA